VDVFASMEEETALGDGYSGAFPAELVFGEALVSLGHASGRCDDPSSAFSGGSSFVSAGTSLWESLQRISSSYSETACDACGCCAWICFLSCHVWRKRGRLSVYAWGT